MLIFAIAVIGFVGVFIGLAILAVGKDRPNKPGYRPLGYGTIAVCLAICFFTLGPVVAGCMSLIALTAANQLKKKDITEE